MIQVRLLKWGYYSKFDLTFNVRTCIVVNVFKDSIAPMAKLANAPDLKSGTCKSLRVRFPLGAPG